MKKALITFFILSSLNGFSQSGMWIWISGDSAINSSGVYGTQGVPSVQNHPPGGYEYVDWKDKTGNFWIYGGTHPQSCDMWKYNPATNEWTWVKGDGIPNQNPRYGVKGIADPSNSPGIRSFGVTAWTDTSGYLWLFGGNYLNDLWRYDIGSNEWTWVNGDSLNSWNSGNPFYGTKGIPGMFNLPGGRTETTSAWTDPANNLWLFGGFGYDAALLTAPLNDVWKYNIATDEWTWMAGSSSNSFPGYYGIKGLPSVMNDPGARVSYSRWKDALGNFWLMGGCDFYFNYNDVWKYDVGSDLWTWMAGPNTGNDPGNYLTPCVYSDLSNPHSRYEHKSSVEDNCGRYWMFGGTAYQNYFAYNDLWIFDPVQLKWNLVNGSNITNSPGNFGVMGLAASTNIPPARAGASAWWGDDNHFYMFGGLHTSTIPVEAYSDLWVYIPDTSCIGSCQIIPMASFSSDENICPGACCDFMNLSANSLFYNWSFPGATPDTSTAINPENICYSTPGSYSVTLIATNANGSDTLTLQNYITVYPAPPPQAISQSGDTLIALQGSATYQWYFNTNLISAATDYFYVAPQNGNYSVVATDSIGCEVEAVMNNVIASTKYTANNRQIIIYPNPVVDKLTIQNSDVRRGTAFELSIYNVLGEKIYSVSYFSTANDEPLIVNCEFLPEGIYSLEISSDKKFYRTKFLKH